MVPFPKLGPFIYLFTYLHIYLFIYFLIYLSCNVRKRIFDIFGRAPSEFPDQPAHWKNLIRIFTGQIWGSQRCKVASCGQERLILDCADAQADLNLCLAHILEGTFSLYFRGPVVQSIVCLTSSLVIKLLTVLISTISNSRVFLLNKSEKLLQMQKY